MTKLRNDTFVRAKVGENTSASWPIGLGAPLAVFGDKYRRGQCQAAADYANRMMIWQKRLHQEICRVVMRWDAKRMK